MRYIKLNKNNEITHISMVTMPGLFEIQFNDVDIGDVIFDGSLLKKPSNNHHWNPQEKKFEIDPFVHTQLLRNSLKVHRDSRLQSIIEYNGLYARNDIETENRLNSAINLLKLIGDPTKTIRWKGVHDPLDSQQKPRWKEATLEDLIGLLIVGGSQIQKAFHTEEIILKRHQITPYIDVESAIIDFDREFYSQF